MLINQYDAALFDLDGVVYLGPNVIPGVPETMSTLREQGIKIGFVTNNAARTPETVAEHLRELGIEATSDDVVNSTMATLRILKEHLPEGARVLPIGARALAEQLRDAGYDVVETSEDEPVAVVQGYDPHMDWTMLEDGAFAVQGGAQWFVTNPDMTRPSERGIVPGCGAQVAVIQACVEPTPLIAGKPYRPLLDETVARLQAERPVFVGDRLDTDILGANNVGMESLFVFTGAHGKRDLLTATPDHRPTCIGFDAAALLRPMRASTRDASHVTCGAQRVARADGRLETTPEGMEEQLDALWALLDVAWNEGVDVTEALDSLDLVR